MTVVLDTPAQIDMWVLLSRRAQIKLQMKGLPTKGLVKWMRENIPGCEKARTVKQCIVPLEYMIAENGGRTDYTLVNVHVMRVLNGKSNVFLDCGIYNDMSAVEANEGFVSLYRQGRLEIVFTLDDVREPNGRMYEGA